MKILAALLWITALYNLVGGYENSEGSALCLNPEDLHT